MLRFIAVPFRLCVQDKENMSVCNLHLNLAKRKRIWSPVQLIQPFLCVNFTLDTLKTYSRVKIIHVKSSRWWNSSLESGLPYITPPQGGTMATRNLVLSLLVCAFFENLEFTNFPRNIKNKCRFWVTSKINVLIFGQVKCPQRRKTNRKNKATVFDIQLLRVNLARCDLPRHGSSATEVKGGKWLLPLWGLYQDPHQTRSGTNKGGTNTRPFPLSCLL